jgi:4-hydroxybenzoate polyprenyltransferase
VILALVESLRPRQVVKNGFIFVGLIFGRRLFHYPDNVIVLAGFGLFTLLSWAGYLFNDLRDREQDRLHPVKSSRPIAAGRLPAPAAAAAAAGLAAAGLAGAFVLSRPFGWVCLAYAALTLAYSLALRHQVILDIMAIAAGFFLRVLAGTVIIGVRASHWLVVCAIFVSLFLAACKRRTELERQGGDARAILKEYDVRFLDTLIAALTAGTLLSYVLYTVSAETIAWFGTEALLATAPFVLYGVFRYLYLIYVRQQGEDTADALLADAPLLLAAAGWLASVALIVYFRPEWL